MISRASLDRPRPTSEYVGNSEQLARIVAGDLTVGNRDMSDVLESVRDSLMQTLQLGSDRLAARRDLQLLGSVPEFDSMAVLAVLTELEERFGIEFDDDEIDAEIFETLGSLSDFVEKKLGAL